MINTSELYASNGQSVSLASSGTLPKMSFAPMKEELSRTLPSKGFPSLGETLRYSELPHPMRGSATSSPAKNNGDLGERKQTRSASRSRDRWVVSSLGQEREERKGLT